MKRYLKNVNLQGFLLAASLVLLGFLFWLKPAEAGDLATEPQPASMAHQADNPWRISDERGNNHSHSTIHLEMRVQLERALDVAFDELRKVDQASQGVQPWIEILIHRQDGHTVEITGQHNTITRRLIEAPMVCDDLFPSHPECPD
jgi:hypothetical protein